MRWIKKMGLVTLICVVCLIISKQSLHLGLRHSLSALTRASLRSAHRLPSKDSVSQAAAAVKVKTPSKNSSVPHNDSPCSPRPNDGKGGVKGGGLPLLTLFSTWKDPAHISLIRNLTLRNWAQLGPRVTLLLFTNDTNTAAQARCYGWHTLPVSKTAVGVPVLKYMYLDAMNSFNSTLYAYANGDLLFTEGLVNTLEAVLGDSSSLPVSQNSSLFLVGRRTNVPNVTEQEARNFHNVSLVGRTRGKLFLISALDVFITDRRFPWDQMPEVVIGRIRYDSWLVMYAIQHGHVTIDVTRTVPAIHQTTRAGDFEGRSHPNSSYNINLLKEVYNVTDFKAGTVKGTPWHTLHNSEGAVVVKRKRQGG